MYFATAPQIATQPTDNTWNTITVDSQFDGMDTVIVKCYDHQVRSISSTESLPVGNIYSNGPNIFYVNVANGRQFQARHITGGEGTLEVIAGFTSAEVTTFDQSQLTTNLSPSLLRDDTWEEIDVSAELTGDPTAAIVMVGSNGNEGLSGFGFGQTGSTAYDAFGPHGSRLEHFLVPVVAGQIRVRVFDTGTDVYLVGQVDSGITLVSALDDKTVISQVWSDIDVSTELAGGNVAWVYSAATFTYAFNAVTKGTGVETGIGGISLLPVVTGDGLISVYTNNSCFVSPYWVATATTDSGLVVAELELDAPPQYGATLSGAYTGYTGVPTGPVTVTDSAANVLSVTVTINDNGDGTGTFSGTFPSLPAAGADAPALLTGDVTLNLPDPDV